jgi:hypothetical protein
MRLQAERHKAEDALRPFAMQRAGYWFKPVAGPEPPPEPAAAPTEPTGKEFAAMTPAEPDFPPPDPEELEDLLTSTSPIVRAFARRMQAVPVAVCHAS